ncbi:MAG: hypothetical protein ACTTI3_05695 [Treponema sp.]
MCALIWYEINKMLTDTAAKYVFAVLALRPLPHSLKKIRRFFPFFEC